MPGVKLMVLVNFWINLEKDARLIHEDTFLFTSEECKKLDIKINEVGAAFSFPRANTHIYQTDIGKRLKEKIDNKKGVTVEELQWNPLEGVATVCLLI